MIADDSAIVRGLLARWLEADGEIEVVRSVADGEQAVRQLAPSDAEIVVLDIDMPVLSGIDALPKLLAIRPALKILMSSTLTRRNATISMRALNMGAADFVPKPQSVRGVTTSEEFRYELIAKVKMLGALARNSAAKAALSPSSAVDRLSAVAPPPAAIRLRRGAEAPPQVLAIGSSTGGPQALTSFFESLAGKINVPVVITQHMPPTFTGILAEQLAKVSRAPATEGSDGEVLEPGRLYVAPGGHHMLLQRSGGNVVIKLDDGPAENFCRPAVDPMFRSLSAAYGAGVLAVVLTGMGQDGRAGAQEITKNGGTILVQDQATSVVWGMPGAVAEAGLASAVLPLSEIAPKVAGLLKGKSI
ncbi:MAG TPA: chemotaxis response regulator protein-glutamate methylesterase [Alphaproteobacteria bacterium]|nr:chemotaxis response regulator protein-glutamate methylesterase [Alphaproteobacteria bacterium]